MKKRISRRKVLKTAGGLVGIALPVWVITGKLPIRNKEALHPPGKRTKIRQWAMVIDLRKCDGCVSIGKPPQCTEGCIAEHAVPEGTEWIKVLEVKDENGGTHFLPRLCMHCENAPCLNVCPVGATYRDEEGVILINHERCIGCRLCMAACPYGARSFNWEQPENPPGALFAEYTPQYPVPHRVGTVEKCVFCVHHAGKELPACAASCPMKAIYFGDLTEDVATNGVEIVKLSTFLSENNAFRLKEELGTRPRVWYIRGHGEAYGRDANDRRKLRKARNWQEQGTAPHGHNEGESGSHEKESEENGHDHK